MCKYLIIIRMWVLLPCQVFTFSDKNLCKCKGKVKCISKSIKYILIERSSCFL